jgi:apurinic endonuclease APN1
MSLIGIHIHKIDNVIQHINENFQYKDINLIQIFVTGTIDYNNKKYIDVLKYLKDNKIKLIVHGSYSINLSKTWCESDWWIQQLISEIKCCSQLGAFGIIIHTGKSLKLNISESLNNMYTSLLYIHHKTEEYQNIKIIIETPSGQGTEILTNIEEFCRFMNKFYSHPHQKVRDRFGICIDTCHIFAAGNDIRTSEGIDYFFKIIDQTIGIDKIKICHLNDSKKGLGEHLDRHLNIGKGHIGKKSLFRITKFMKKLNIPIVLETPENNISDDYILLKKL